LFRGKNKNDFASFMMLTLGVGQINSALRHALDKPRRCFRVKARAYFVCCVDELFGKFFALRFVQQPKVDCGATVAYDYLYKLVASRVSGFDVHFALLIPHPAR